MSRSEQTRSKKAPHRKWVNYRVESMIGVEVKHLHVVAGEIMVTAYATRIRRLKFWLHFIN